MNICEPLNNLTSFVHPEHKESYRFMTEQEVNGLADTFVLEIKNSDRKNILSIDSGTAPLVEIMKRRSSNLEYRSVKVPREPLELHPEVLLFHLSESERGTMEKQIRLLFSKLNTNRSEDGIKDVFSLLQNRPANKTVLELNALLAETEFAQFLKEPIVLMDEYVTSGTVLFNTVLLLLLFNREIDLKILTYFFNTIRKDKPQEVLFSNYFQDDMLQGYTNGIYPFENRIDLIGYYYVIKNGKMKKIFLRDLHEKTNHSSDAFLLSLETLIKNKIPRMMNEQLDTYNNISHTARYLIYLLEGDEDIKELFLQHFEMYAPIWAPMPLEFHIDFVRAYEESAELKKLAENKLLKQQYKQSRQSIINLII